MAGAGVEDAEQISRVVDVLKGKWTIAILCAMRQGPVRLSALRRKIPTASKKGLTSSLRSLELMRLVVRRDLSNHVLHVEYELSTDIRDSVISLLEFLSEWARIVELPSFQVTSDAKVQRLAITNRESLAPALRPAGEHRATLRAHLQDKMDD